MGKASFGSIFLMTFVSGLFFAVGVDPYSELAIALNQVIDSLTPTNIGFSIWAFKFAIYSMLVIVPLIVDVFIILESGIGGVIAAFIGFSAGLFIIFVPMLGAILFIIGILASLVA